MDLTALLENSVLVVSVSQQLCHRNHRYHRYEAHRVHLINSDQVVHRRMEGQDCRFILRPWSVHRASPYLASRYPHISSRSSCLADMPCLPPSGLPHQLRRFQEQGRRRRRCPRRQRPLRHERLGKGKLGPR